MSEEIIININPSASDNIVIDATSPAPENIQVTPILSDVASVNGKTGVVILNKSDIGLDQVDNTSDLNKPISLSAIAFVNNKFLPLSGGNVTGTLNVFTKILSGGVDLANVYLTNNSSIVTVFNTNSAKYESVYSNVNTNSATYATVLFTNNKFLPLSGGIINGNLYVISGLYVAGSAFYVNAQDLIVKDPIIYIAENNQTDFLDIGFMASWTNDPPGYSSGGYQHGGLVRRSDNKIWTLFSGATAEPLSALNVNWYQNGILLEPLSAKFYGDIYGDRIVYGSLSSTNKIFALNGDSDLWNSVYNTVNPLSSNWSYASSAAISYTHSNFVPLSGGSNISLNIGPLTSTKISLSDLVFTGSSSYAKALTGRNLFVEVKVGNTTKYLQLFDIDKAYTYYVDFDGPSEVKTAYTSGNVTLSGIPWNLTEALIGTEVNEVISGIRSARLRGYATTTMTMLSDKADGISNIRFFYRSYINTSGSPDTIQVPWVVDYSTDSGVTWLSAGVFTATSTLQTFNANVNVTGSARIRFRTTATGSTNRRANIDNITINPYT